MALSFSILWVLWTRSSNGELNRNRVGQPATILIRTQMSSYVLRYFSFVLFYSCEPWVYVFSLCRAFYKLPLHSCHLFNLVLYRNEGSMLCTHPYITEGENMRLSGSIYPVVLLLLAAFAFSVPTGKLISHFVCVCVCARAPLPFNSFIYILVSNLLVNMVKPEPQHVNVTSYIYIYTCSCINPRNAHPSE